MNAALASIFLMIGIGIIFYTIFRSRRSEAESEAALQIQDLLDLESLEDAPVDDATERKKSKRSQRLVNSLSGSLSRSKIAQTDDGKGIISQVNRWLYLGGMRDDYTPEQYIAQTGVIWVLGIGGAVLLSISGTLPPFLTGLGALYALIYPVIRVRRNIKNRQDKIEREIPNFISELYMSLSAGIMINQAIVRSARAAAEDGNGDILPREFAQAQVEYTMGGLDEETALRRVAWRCGLDSVSNLVEALIQGIRTGSDLRVTLLNYSDQAQEMWNQAMREYKNSKEPSITIGVVVTMGGGFIIYSAPLLVGLMETLNSM